MSEHAGPGPDGACRDATDVAAEGQEGGGWRTMLVMLASMLAYAVLASDCAGTAGIDAHVLRVAAIDAGLGAPVRPAAHNGVLSAAAGTAGNGLLAGPTGPFAGYPGRQARR